MIIATRATAPATTHVAVTLRRGCCNTSTRISISITSTMIIATRATAPVTATTLFIAARTSHGKKASALSNSPNPNPSPNPTTTTTEFKLKSKIKWNSSNRRNVRVSAFVDPWATSTSISTVDSQSVASQLFAVSLVPYLIFLYLLTKSKTAPKLTLFGFYFLLAFVAATIPAGIYAKVQYGTSLSNVDWLHGAAESLLTLTNLFIVLGLRKGLSEMSGSDLTSSRIDVKGSEADGK